MNKTTVSVKRDDANREWLLIDLEGQTVGRAAAKIASILRGKHKPTFTPHTDTGDFVVVINAAKVRFTGAKLLDKTYIRHTGHPGGIRETRAEEMLAKHPDRVIGIAVKGMLPKGPLGRQMLRKFKIYAGAEHPHEAQQPRPFAL
jgi:large subunit ribosomal protein L13